MAKAKKSVHKYSSKHRKALEEVSASTFKNSCLQLLDRVHQTREEIVVTKYGRPVAKLVAFDQAEPSLFGMLEGSITIHSDIVAPLDDAWDVED